jgi:DNA (cytosine-5)-methyltransferase 1
MDLSKIKLLEKCKELGFTKLTSKNKTQLIALIESVMKETVPVEDKALPVEDKALPVEDKALPVEDKALPIEDKALPVEDKALPIEDKALPVEDKALPIEDKASLTSHSALNVIDLFCGCGGMSKGLTDAGLNIIAGIDIWDKAVASYNQNFEHNAYCEDLTQLPPERFNELYNKDNKTVDILVGGPPCQSFSIAGKRDKADPRNALFMEYVKYLDYFQPKAFIMENVIGMLSKKTESGENVIDIIMAQLTRNYNCTINKLYASDFEVPQNRRRVIIIGFRKDLMIVPKPVESVTQNRIPVKTVLQPKEEIEQKYYLSERALAGIKNKKGVNQEKGFGFGAQMLDFDKPSYTIPARYWKDGYDALVKYSETEIRRLTITELKRIQSFPDDYIIEGSNKDTIMQIGNAVACRFAFHLGQYIQRSLSTSE